MIKDINAITPEYMKHRIEEEAQQYKQEIERLNNKNEELLTLYTTEREVKDYYKNIINELEKEISKHIALCIDITLNDILDKIQELKGSDKK